MACHVYSRSLRAADQRDYVYGLLRLSGLDVLLDYSATKLVGEVYCDFVSAILKLYSVNLKGWTSFPDLLFLMFAGVGKYTQTDPGFPSWAPNFPQE